MQMIREKQCKNQILKTVFESQNSWPFRKSVHSLTFFVYMCSFLLDNYGKVTQYPVLWYLQLTRKIAIM